MFTMENPKHSKAGYLILDVPLHTLYLNPRFASRFRGGGLQFATANYFVHTLRYPENTHEINVEFYLLFSILAIQNINTLEKGRLIFFHKPT